MIQEGSREGAKRPEFRHEAIGDEQFTDRRQRSDRETGANPMRWSTRAAVRRHDKKHGTERRSDNEVHYQEGSRAVHKAIILNIVLVD
jgi:hypothetical protein